MAIASRSSSNAQASTMKRTLICNKTYNKIIIENH